MRVIGDGVIQRIDGIFQVPLKLVGLRFLKPRAVGFRVQFQRLLSVLQALFRIARTVVIGTEIHVRRCELAVPLFIQCDRFLVARDRARIIAQRLLREPERVQRFHIRGIDSEALFQFLACGLPVVLYEK